MELALFQLLPRPPHRTPAEVLEQARWEVAFAEEEGFESVWLAEHHGPNFGMIGAPSLWAAHIAATTKRLRIGYGVAVVPLHQPLRLAEEITWLDLLSGGRVMVGVGPGFIESEFAAFGVPLDERHARLDDGLRVIRRALASGEIEPGTRRMPPFYRAVSSVESARRAAADGMPILIGTKPTAFLRELRDAGVDLASAYVLRQITLEQQLDCEELEDAGVRRVICWFHFGDANYSDVRETMRVTLRNARCVERRETPR